MSVETQVAPPEQAKRMNTTMKSISRIAKFSAVRLLMLFFTVVVSIFLTIMIANMGGYVDNIVRSTIRENIMMSFQTDPVFKTLPPEKQKERIDTLIALEEKRVGLDKPFIVRAFSYLKDALVLDLGRAQYMTSDTGSRQVSLIILERLPPTLLLMGTSNFALFFSSLFLALTLSRYYGSIWDKILIALSPLSSAPSWFYGVFMILIFAAILRVLPFGGMIDAPVPDTQLGYMLSVLKHLILPAGALIISAFFVSVYNWRTFFLIYSSEDYVEMAKAKGLPPRDIERRYILRPTLPTIITSFSLTLIALWTGAIITETVFVWPGLGRATFQAVGAYDTAVIVGVTIIYAYLLSLTVFLLDFLYALVDPRVQVGSGNGS